MNDAHARGEIQQPIPTHNGEYPIIQYADDTIVVMPACPLQANRMKQMLFQYATSVGLKINFHKSTLVPINLDRVRAEELSHIFGCVVGQMPFTYLGLPMGTTRPSIVDLMPLVSSVQRRIPAMASPLDYGSKLTLVNSVVTSLAIYAMCSIKLHPRIIKHLDKLRRCCLWQKKI